MKMVQQVFDESDLLLKICKFYSNDCDNCYLSEFKVYCPIRYCQECYKAKLAVKQWAKIMEDYDSIQPKKTDSTIEKE